MSDVERVQELLEEILDTNRTPEEACVTDPDLLNEVRARWARVQSLKHAIEELFPGSATGPSAPGFTEVNSPVAPPKIDGNKVEATLGREPLLNWLWLALTYQMLGRPEQAREWSNKASAWLNTLDGTTPANADALNRYRHDLLEAHALCREVESFLARLPEKPTPSDP
ncbi:hypothetical protein BH10PLA2_BH10PLA2_18510 [soil metagenome]